MSVVTVVSTSHGKVFGSIDLAELKTFVELASAEDDLTVMKVSGLRASCATFATFLFEVNEQTSLADLETICASVFQAFKTDPQLLTKWVRFLCERVCLLLFLHHL